MKMCFLAVLGLKCLKLVSSSGLIDIFTTFILTNDISNWENVFLICVEQQIEEKIDKNHCVEKEDSEPCTEDTIV